MRTTETLATKRSAGQRVGRPRACPDHVLERVIRLPISGATLTAAHRQGHNAAAVISLEQQ